MKVLVVSDTHGHDANIERVLKTEENIDMLLHLGDYEDSDDYIEALAEVPCEFVRGNNDFGSYRPSSLLIKLGGYRTFLTHGTGYGLYFGETKLMLDAEDKRADIVIYGHIHKPVLKVEILPSGSGRVLVVNPGSLTYPRQGNRRPSYIVMYVNEPEEKRSSECFEYLPGIWAEVKYL